MTPYYEGTSEAEHLIRGSPELAEPWLKKARQDRRRLAVRLFQRQKREFLDGFINSLEGYLATRKEPEDRSAEGSVPAPARDEHGPPAVADVDLGEARPQAIEELSVSELEGELRPELIEPDPRAAEIVVIHEAAGLLPELPEVEAKTVETVAPNVPDDRLADRDLLDAAAERALGVMRLSGWTVDVDPQISEVGGGDDVAANQPGDFPDQTGGPLPGVDWNRVFEQARGVGMVDLSAYDFIDGLGELRDLIDHWQTLHQDPSAGDAP